MKSKDDFNNKQIVDLFKENFNKEISKATIINYQHNLYLKMFIKAKKPYLRQENIVKRYEMAKTWLFVPDDHWKNVLWSDKSPFERLNTPNNRYCRRKLAERYLPENCKATVKCGGGKIMVWGYFSYNGVGKLVKIKGKMDSKQYIEILANNLEDSITNLKLENPIFQHGNDKAY